MTWRAERKRMRSARDKSSAAQSRRCGVSFLQQTGDQMSRIRIREWVHANICVRDLARTIPFYEMLGFEKFDDNVFEQGAGVWDGLGLPEGRRFRAVFMRIPGNRPRPFLDIIQFLDPPTAGEPYPTLHNVGIGRLCFEVDDLFEVAKVLEQHEVSFVGPISRYETARGMRSHRIDCEFLCFRDPDGTVLEYIQFKRQSS
jgi:catechol 2,3-dioxygenase-like lactoylglutathione lyase family enzyme